jgi:predicted metal-dependent hydrolase
MLKSSCGEARCTVSQDRPEKTKAERLLSLGPGRTITIDSIIRSRRRTLALVIEDDGRLTVRAPLRASEGAIHRFVTEHERWVLAKQEQARARVARFAPKRYVSGEEFLYLGDPYRLEIVDRQRPSLSFNGGFRLAQASVPRARRLFEKWYRRRASVVLSERVEWFSASHGFEPKGVGISSARKQWGSCGPTGNLRFAWRLVMAPLPIVDYVVVHELVHLRYRRHGKRFWGKVKSILPDFRDRRGWLQENGYLLSLD